jgi:hypothetical protein
VIVPNLFDRSAKSIELTSFDRAPAEEGAHVETMSELRVRSSGGVYLQIVLPPYSTELADPSAAANDDAVAKLLQLPTRSA